MSSLTEFLREQKAAAQSPDIVKKQDEWIKVVEALLAQIRKWLSEEELQKLISVDSDQVSITEETIGTYTAPSLTLTVPGTKKRVKVVPIGRTIIGANGRVDMKFSHGSYLLLYLADRKEWVHGTGSRPDDFPVLNEDLFKGLLMRALQ